MKYISETNIVAFNKLGTASFGLEPGIAAEVPHEFLSSLIEQGAVPDGELASQKVEDAAPAVDKVAAIVGAMRTLLETGNPEVLEAGGIPRTTEIDAIVGFRSNKGDREAAWAVVEG